LAIVGPYGAARAADDCRRAVDCAERAARRRRVGSTPAHSAYFPCAWLADRAGIRVSASRVRAVDLAPAVALRRGARARRRAHRAAYLLFFVGMSVLVGHAARSLRTAWIWRRRHLSVCDGHA